MTDAYTEAQTLLEQRVNGLLTERDHLLSQVKDLHARLGRCEERIDAWRHDIFARVLDQIVSFAGKHSAISEDSAPYHVQLARAYAQSAYPEPEQP